MPDTHRMSSDFDWTPPHRGQYFQLLHLRWSVEKAYQVVGANPRPIQMFEVNAKWWDWVGDREIRWSQPDENGHRTMISRGGWIHVDWKQVDKLPVSVLDHPVVFIPLDDKTGQRKPFPIEGWDRIAKALDLSIEALPFVILTEDEEASIRLP